MVDNRSYKVWLVEQYGYEYATPIGAYTLRKAAQKKADSLSERAGDDPDKRYRITQINLVTHDGAHTLHEELIQAVGKNKG